MKKALIVLLALVFSVFIVVVSINITIFSAKNLGKFKNMSDFQNPEAPSLSVDDLLLPDLQIRFPSDLYIDFDPETRKKEIRFSTTTVNLGDGPLIMLGSESENKTKVIQQIMKKDGSAEEKVIGSFVLHPEHGHWHFEDFTEMELLALNKDGSPGKQIATTGKITSCVHDLERLSSPTAGSPESGDYEKCGRDIQGLSVGWSDTYAAILPGQNLNIDKVPDGIYALRLWVDRSDLISETNNENNFAMGVVEIKGSLIKVLESEN